MKKNILLLLLSSITVLGGYAFLRYAYHVTDHFPFTQEIVLIIIGTVATVLITALLLNKQTAVEIEKEQSVKFIELKTGTYEELIRRIESMFLADSVTDKDIIRLQFTTHRLAIFSSPEVLKEFFQFLETIRLSIKDGIISNDSIDVSMALAKLTVKIREDLIGDIDLIGNYSKEQIQQLIVENSNRSSKLEAH
ncbi:MAG TPA: hypothetical protein ENJ60_09765 [Aeromonadales bacterium]|nr:hypothetical protein [Aeromonadales bacterium]